MGEVTCAVCNGHLVPGKCEHFIVFALCVDVWVCGPICAYTLGQKHALELRKSERRGGPQRGGQ